MEAAIIKSVLGGPVRACRCLAVCFATVGVGPGTAEAILAAEPGAAEAGRTLGSEDIASEEGAVDTSL